MINEALKHNLAWDRLCFVLVGVFAATGVATVVAILTGVYKSAIGVDLVGLAATALCWPCIRWANTISSRNMAIRLLEVALNNAKTADEASVAINKAFSYFLSQDGGQKRVGT